MENKTIESKLKWQKFIPGPLSKLDWVLFDLLAIFCFFTFHTVV